jgi:hypothetical protein
VQPREHPRKTSVLQFVDAEPQRTRMVASRFLQIVTESRQRDLIVHAGLIRTHAKTLIVRAQRTWAIHARIPLFVFFLVVQLIARDAARDTADHTTDHCAGGAVTATGRSRANQRAAGRASRSADRRAFMTL